MIEIYSFTNIVNGKKYIGQFIDTDRRRNDHLRSARLGRVGFFYDAVQKYGQKNFTFEILEECSVKEMNDHERGNL